MHKKLISTLENIGLTKIEAQLYLTLLELGPTSAGLILEKSGIQNSSLHRSLVSLNEKEIISYRLEGRKKIYSATDPSFLLELLNKRTKEFREILPELSNLQVNSSLKNKTDVFKGIEAIKKLYNQIIIQKTAEYNSFGGGKSVTFEIMGKDWWETFHQNRIKKRIKSRQVFDKSLSRFSKELNQKELTKIKLLPAKFEQLQETVITDTQVAIIIFTENPYAILIQDPIVVENYKKQFELIWNSAEKQ